MTNVPSTLAYIGAAIECGYAASKGALLSLTKSHVRGFAREIRVNCVAPGRVETAVTSDRTPEEELAGIPVGHYGRSEDVAEAVASLRDARVVTGGTPNVNGGELMR